MPPLGNWSRQHGTLGRVGTPFLLRSDDGLVFTSRDDTRMVRSYGLKQEFIMPHCPQQNGMIERLIRSLKEGCVHRPVNRRGLPRRRCGG